MRDNNKKQVTDLHECYCSGIKPELAMAYLIKINEDKVEVKSPLITGNELHALAGTTAETHFIAMKTPSGKKPIGPNIKVNLTECGIERFIIKPFEQESLDLETCFCEGMNPYITYKYVIKVNKEKITVEEECLTGKEILQRAGFDSSKTELRMFTKEGNKLIANNEKVDFTACGIERFSTMALNCTEGFTAPLAILPPADIKFLDSLALKVDFLRQGNSHWLIIRDYNIPDGFNVDKSDCAIFIHQHYPRVQIDMFYFNPPLVRKDGKLIKQLSTTRIFGTPFQRWSRHRTANNVWRVGVDNIESHLNLMNACLIDEFTKR